MGKVIEGKTADEVMAAVWALDLDPIKIKLMDEDEGEGWSREKADQVEVLYRRFLLLTVTTEQPIVPTKDIDAFWHQHILDTRKYAEDCQKTFGFFLHHFPYFGMRGAEDSENLQRSFEASGMLYEKRFGESYGHLHATGQNCSSCGAGSCGNCSSACAGTSCSGVVADAPGVVDLMNVKVRPSLQATA